MGLGRLPVGPLQLPGAPTPAPAASHPSNAQDLAPAQSVKAAPSTTAPSLAQSGQNLSPSSQPVAGAAATYKPQPPDLAPVKSQPAALGTAASAAAPIPTAEAHPFMTSWPQEHSAGGPVCPPCTCTAAWPPAGAAAAHTGVRRLPWQQQCIFGLWRPQRTICMQSLSIVRQWSRLYYTPLSVMPAKHIAFRHTLQLCIHCISALVVLFFCMGLPG